MIPSDSVWNPPVREPMASDAAQTRNLSGTPTTPGSPKAAGATEDAV